MVRMVRMVWSLADRTFQPRIQLVALALGLVPDIALRLVNTFLRKPGERPYYNPGWLRAAYVFCNVFPNFWLIVGKL